MVTFKCIIQNFAGRKSIIATVNYLDNKVVSVKTTKHAYYPVGLLSEANQKHLYKSMLKDIKKRLIRAEKEATKEAV